MSKLFAISLLGLLFLVEAVFILSKSLKTDNALDIPPEWSCGNTKTGFDLAAHLKNLDKDSLKTSFPYQAFLDSANWCDIQCIRQDMVALNAFNPGNANQNQEILYRALTDELTAKIRASFETYHPDSLLDLLRWAGKFDDYKDVDTANARAYSAICSYWFGFVTNHLSGYAATNSSLKYQFKFRYIEGLCQTKQFDASTNESNFEKIVLDAVDSKWSYLFNKFWYSTGFLFKTVVFLGFFATVYSYIYVITKLIKLIRK